VRHAVLWWMLPHDASRLCPTWQAHAYCASSIWHNNCTSAPSSEGTEQKCGAASIWPYTLLKLLGLTIRLDQDCASAIPTAQSNFLPWFVQLAD
jgi:hypothetical protein